MAHFTVTLAILSSTWAVLGAAACQDQAELEGSCNPRSRGRVALQTGNQQLVESITEEVPDITEEVPDVGFAHRGETKTKGESLTQSALAEVTQTKRWKPWKKLKRRFQKKFRKKPAPTPAPTPASVADALVPKVLDDYKHFQKMCGEDWKALPREEKGIIVELCDNATELREAEGKKSWDELGDCMQQAVGQCRHAALLQVSEQRFFDRLKAWVTGVEEAINSVIQIHEDLLAKFGQEWDNLSTIEQTLIITFACNESTFDQLARQIVAIIGQERWDLFADEVKKFVEERCEKEQPFPLVPFLPFLPNLPNLPTLPFFR
eukprot:CAMPEP_0172716590 /NCGR_PEP_ID=MMETSP1074-20121228/68882_1 /TAXON_ID=2916 /ORGANISM="Ceratium fusus, Strain PA161109" /LENGTH=319 /DNA_ID=CAMNT_0013541331 /DNA_START=62 /DNA_END=1021 /DNA_ORIENTATION=+